MKKLTMLFVCLAFLGIQIVNAQTRTITGTVTTSEDGSKLPGVNVIVKGTTTGTITNVDGYYSVSVNADAPALVFSFVGMKVKEIVLGTSNVIDVVMDPETVGVDEVVVTALGIRKEAKALGYAVQEVKSDDLNKAGNPDLSKALQGKIAGVDIKVTSGMPGASSQIIIRGARSFTGNNTPLYVVDGMPIESTSPYISQYGVDGSDNANRAIDINPSDIESINVLKGQAAAALYGMRASNGVVIITTKSGKGGPMGKTVVTLSQNTSFDVVSRKPDYQTTYAQGSAGSYLPVTSKAWGPKIVDLPDDPDYGGNVDGSHPGQYFVRQREAAGLDPWATPKVYDNWDDYFKTAVNSTTGINVSKATDEGNMSVGLGYTNQDGVALNTGMKRWNVKASSERKLNKNFSSGFSANYTNLSLSKLGVGSDASLQGIYMAPPSYDLKGIPNHVVGDIYAQNYYRGLSYNNPYWVAENNDFTEETNRFYGNAFIDYKAELNEAMKVTVKYQLGMDTYTSHYQNILGYGNSGGNGSIDNFGTTQATANSLLTAIYDWKITDDLNFNLLLGNEFNHSNLKRYEEYGENFNYGGWNHIQNATTATAYEEQYQDRTVGFFGNLSLDYKSMLYFSATGRNDIVSSMPNGSRSFFYPSVSLGFLISELEPVKDITWISFAKIRASYAEVGQAGDYTDNYYSTPSYGGSWWDGNPIQYPVNGVSSYTKYYKQYDPKLKPQNTKSYEVGANLKFYENRIGLDYTYSNQNVVDQIFDVPLAGSTGATYLVMNGGKMQTISHELVLSLVPIKTDDFTWDVSVNYSKIDNECKELATGVESIMLGGYTTPQVRVAAGYSFPVVYGSMYARDEQGRILVNEDPNSRDYGMPMAGADGIMATVSPDFILGWSTNFTYKSVTLGAVFEWKSGGHMYNATDGMMDYYGVSKRVEDRESTFVFKGYKADGTPNDIVRGGPNDSYAYENLYCNVLGNIDESYVVGNSFVKLREVSLKYSVPKTLIPGIDLSINAFARNILLWSELDNVDPECSLGNSNMAGGFERFSLPQTTSYGFGIEVKF